MQVALGNFSLTGIDASGVEKIVTGVDGWGVPGSTGTFTQKPRASGAWVGDSFSKNREVTVNGTLTAASPAETSAAFDALVSAVPLNVPTPLVIDDGAGARWVPVTQAGEIIPVWRNMHTIAYSLIVASTDWRKFGDTMTASTALPSSTGGLTIPFTIPFSIDAVTVSGQVSLVNPGNESGPVTLRIDGPFVGPVITHVSSGSSLVFSESLSMGAGEYLIVDMEKRTALANGQSSRAGWITSRGWSSFDPGVNVWAFTAAENNPDSLLTVSAVPAWR